MTKITDASNFLDVNGLNDIRLKATGTDKAEKREALESVAKQFESIFMQMLLKSMRKAQEVLESDSPFNSQSTKFYRDMHDQQMAVELSEKGSLGLSDLIVRQLGGDDGYKPSSILRGDGGLHVRTSQHINKSLFEEEAIKKVSSNDPMGIASLMNNYKHVEQLVSNNRLFTDNSDPLQVKQVATQLKPAVETNHFSQPKDFVTALIEPAKRVEAELNIPFAVVIAQAALETGWGKKIIKTDAGESSNNLFNIKANMTWQGDKAQKETLEFEHGSMVKKREPFRVYPSLQDSVNDYIKLLSTSDRYQSALDKVNDVERFMHGLQEAGYATDPKYAEKVLGTLRKVSSLLDK